MRWIESSHLRDGWRRHCSAIVGTLACCALSVVAAGCSPDSFEPSNETDQSRVESILDPQVTAYGFEPRVLRFDGKGGTVFADDGWAPPGEDSEGSFAWALDSRASLWFAPPSVGEGLEFRALCRALAFDGAPPQEVAVRMGGAIVGSAVVGERWHEIIIPIPGDVAQFGLNRIDLEFSWSRKPADVGLNLDRRDLSVAFRWVAIGPAGSSAPEKIRSGLQMLDIDGGTMTLQPGDDVAIPVPPGTFFHADLGGSSQMRGMADIEVVFGHPESENEEQWHDRVDSNWGREFGVENSSQEIGHFVIRNLSDSVPAVMDWLPERFRIDSIRGKTRLAKPHVFLYVVDTVRVDSLALFGGGRPTTPELEAFARDAVVYENAVSASTWTLPSVVSMLTGVYPFRHGVMKGDVKLSLESPYPTLASLLSEVGYDTVGISQSFVAGPKYGIDTGFGRFFFNNQLNGIRLRSEEIRRVLTEWLSYEHDFSRPVFGYVHTVGPHAPYRPTGRFRRYADASPGNLPEAAYSPSKFISEGHGRLPAEVEHLRALYEGEVEYADAEFGRFLDALRFFGLYEESIVIFVSDHGEEFADHGGFDHGRTVFDEVAKVPLVVKYPKWHASGRTTIDERVSTVDIFATILELTDAGSGDTISDGRPLPDVSRGKAELAEEHRAVLSELHVVPNEIYRSVNYRALWVGSTKCIENLEEIDRFGESEPRVQVFDTDRDPGESAPVSEGDSRYQLCRELLNGWARVIGDAPDGTRGATLASDEALEMLRSLGYIK